MRFTTPVFGADGQQIGEVALGQGEARPLPTYRDPVKEAEERERRIDELFQQHDPTMFAARKRLEACHQATAGYLRRVAEIQEAIQQLRPLSPDAPLGMAEERAQSMHALRTQLTEMTEEAAAAYEEEQVARRAVDALLEAKV